SGKAGTGPGHDWAIVAVGVARLVPHCGHFSPLATIDGGTFRTSPHCGQLWHCSVGTVRYSASASANEFMSGKRSSGFFASAFRQSASSSGASSGRTVAGGGGG